MTMDPHTTFLADMIQSVEATRKRFETTMAECQAELKRAEALVAWPLVQGRIDQAAREARTEASWPLAVLR